jgi:hypothetical protein
MFQVVSLGLEVFTFRLDFFRRISGFYIGLLFDPVIVLSSIFDSTFVDTVGNYCASTSFRIERIYENDLEG